MVEHGQDDHERRVRYLGRARKVGHDIQSSGWPLIRPIRSAGPRACWLPRPQTARARKEGTVEFGPPRPSRARRAAAPTRARATDVYNPSKNQFSLRPIRLLDSQTGLARMSEKIQPVFKWSNLIGQRENWFCIPLLDAGRFLSIYPVSMFEKQMRIPDLCNKRLCPNFNWRFLIERNRIYKFNRSF